MLIIGANEYFIVLQCTLVILNIYIAYIYSYIQSYFKEIYIKWKLLLYIILALTLFFLLIFNTLY